MACLLFTDADGTWKLHNAKPMPADRFTGWTPDSRPYGDAVERLSDGLGTMFRHRWDYAVAFALENIPSKRSGNLVLQSENFGTTWTVSGTPTRSAAAHTLSGFSLDLLGDDSGAAEEFYQQTIGFTADGVKAIAAVAKKGTSPPTSGSQIILNDATAAADRLKASITWSGDVPVIAMNPGTYLGYELYAGSVYRLLFATASVTAANTNNLSVRPAGSAAEQGNIYAGAMQAQNATVPTDYLYTTTGALSEVALSDVADRLKRHLLNRGTCTVITSDGNAVGGANSQYATCALRPGTEPTLVLNRKTMEFTLSLELLNVAASPAQMIARYAET